MAVYKCKMCGGDLTVNEGSSVCECEYCGSMQTVPNIDDEKKMTLFNRANRLRFNCEFDKAAGVYESIVAEFPEEAEAYWGLVLCKYGIEYVDDPATAKKIPTCHRSSFDSVMDDKDFELVMEYSDPVSRRVYREEAKQFEEIRKGIIEISGKEEPYDIFICYKETDENGQRTLDSVLAQDIYDVLVEKGYRVFFSRITLEDKLGQEYEPYIFAALHSAKLMLAVGTDYEYYNAVWVKNEWSRYLKLIASGEKKVLIPCYKGIDAYDMPKEFARLQAQDLGKVGAMQDLMRGIEKIIRSKQEKKSEAQAAVQTNAANPSVDSYMKRVHLFLEEKDWAKANEYCEKVLDIDPENGEAYLGKLMAELQVRRQDYLKNCEKPFDISNNYQKALRFGDDKLASMLKGYVEHINERNEKKRLTGLYMDAVYAMNEAHTEKEYREAANRFELLGEYENAVSLASECLVKAEELAMEVDWQTDNIAKAVRDHNAGMFQEQLTKEKAKILEIQTLVQSFDDIVLSIQNYESEIQNTEEAIKELYSKKASLGMFAGKEKKQIDTELERLTAKKAAAEIAVNSRTGELKGYSTKQEIDESIQQISIRISELESNIQEITTGGETELSYEQAIENYISNDYVRDRFNAKYPDLVKYLKVIIFGNYYQKSGIIKEPIEWKILETRGNSLLLISKYALDCKQFDDSNRGITWDTCSLRKWLNWDFVNNAFSAKEQMMIQRIIVTADNNPSYDTPSGNRTEDKVFLLSIVEANKYFDSSNERACQGTEYCYAQGAYKSNDDDCFWWLRSPGINNHSAAYVDDDGSVRDGGLNVSDCRRAIRPALWINL